MLAKSYSSADEQQDSPLSGSSSSIWRRTDVVKKGCLHVKNAASIQFFKLKFKSWHARFLVLRDTWTQEEGAGETTLEIHPVEPNDGNSNNSKSHKLLKQSHSTPQSNDRSLPKRCTDPLDERFVNLKNVTRVDVYTTSRSFPYAFTVHRDDKPPLILGAKSDLEMREWMMAIKLLADKASQNGQLQQSTDPQSPPFSEPKNISNCARPSPTATFRCFVVNITSSDVTASASLAAKLNGEFLFCASPSGMMKIISKHGEAATSSRRDGGSEREENSNGASGNTRKELCKWKMEEVRKLKSESLPGKMGDLVTLETSSQCKDFPGTFKFYSTQGLELIQYVRKIAEKMTNVNKSTDELHQNTREIPSSPTSIPRPPPRPLFTISNP